MRSLLNLSDRHSIRARCQALTASNPRRWGHMTVHGMICHLNDCFLSTFGERHASPATGPWQRTLLKWIALWAPFHWPHGVSTRPEFDQLSRGTPPADFERDRAQLLAHFDRFCKSRVAPGVAHPIFGEMTEAEWFRWAYLHLDHHLRQFGA